MLWLVAVAACSTRSEPVPESVKRVPAPIAPLFERVLPGGDRSPPLFGPGGTIQVGARRWTRDGRYLGRHAWAIEGQVRPLAVVGTIEHPLLVAIGWDMELAEGPRTRSWLLVASPGEAKPLARTPIAHEFRDGGFSVSPNGRAIAVAEGDEIVARALPSTAVLGRSPLAPHDDPPVACWIDDARIAWTEVDATGARLRTLTLATGVVTTARLAIATQLICDPGGGFAAMVLPDRVALIDLATSATLATVPIAPSDDDPPVVAVGQRGERLAIASRRGLTIYHRDGAELEALYAHGLPSAPRMQFSPDGAHLAVATTGLTVFGPPAEAHPAVAPSLAFELPAGFEARPVMDAGNRTAWDWAQLATPPGMTAGSVLLVEAVEENKLFADVTAIAIPHDELAGTPGPDATDQQLGVFARTAMPQLFDQWSHAEIESGRDAEFTLRVGRTKGIPWFETRELWRDGCEPYDGYTRVVIDRDAVFVIRALVPPAGSIKGWLEKFFDLPFGNRVQVARRRGPSSGPC
jgi:hypothetical protein